MPPRPVSLIGGSPSVQGSTQVGAFGQQTNVPTNVNTFKPGIIKPDRIPTWMQATFGAAEFGAVDIGSSVLRRASSLIPGDDDFLQQGGNFLEAYKRRNPQLAPQQVDSAFDLLTSPKALVGVTSSQIPFFASLLAIGALSSVFLPAGIALGVAGIGSFLLSYAVEGQGAFDDAIASGATRAEAERTANIVGPISAGIELLQVTKLLKFGGRAKGKLISKAVGFATKRVSNLEKLGEKSLTADFIRTAAVEGLQEAFQGTVHEAGALASFGKPIEKGFLDRRLQEFIGVVPSTVLFGGGLRVLPDSKFKDAITGKNLQISEDEGVIDVPERDKLRDQIMQMGASPKVVSATIGLVDQVSRVFGKKHGVGPGEFYKQKFAFDIAANAIEGQTLMQDKTKVGDFVDTLQGFLESEDTRKAFKDANGQLPAGRVVKALQQAGVRKEQQIFTGISKILKESEFVKLDDLKKAAEDNRIGLVNTVLGGISQDKQEQIAEELQNFESELNQVNDEIKKVESLADQGDPQASSRFDQLMEFKDQLLGQTFRARQAVFNSQETRAQFDNFKIPGPGQDYKELLVRMPQSILPKDVRVDQLPNGNFALTSDNDADFAQAMSKVEGFKTKEEAQEQIKILEDSGENFKEKTGGHFKDQNFIMVHARFDTRTDENSRKVLFIHELQSDPENAIRKKTQEARAKIEVREKKLDSGLIEYNVFKNGKKLEKGPRTGKKLSKFLTKDQAEKVAEDARNLRDEKAPELLAQADEISKDFPFEGSSQALAIRSMLQYAARNGFDAIALSDAKSIAKVVGQTEEALNQLYNTDLPRTLLKQARRFDEKAQLGRVQVDVSEKKVVESQSGRFSVVDKDSNVVAQFDTREEAETAIQETDGNGQAPFNSIDITDSLKENVEQIPLFQDEQGAVTFLKDGRAVIQGLKNPNISTMVHELFHIFRRSAIDEKDLAVLETFYKVKDGVWDVPAEEQSARHFERYIAEGKAPTAGLQRIFQTLKEAMMAVYKGVISSIPLADESIPREVRAVFDRMLHEDSSQITKIRSELDELDGINRVLDENIAKVEFGVKSEAQENSQFNLFNKQDIKANREISKTKPIEGETFQQKLPTLTSVIKEKELNSPELVDLKNARSKVRNEITLKENELEREQRNTFSSETSEIDDALSEEVVMSRVMDLEAEELLVKKGVVSYWKDTLGSLFNQATPLLRRSSGRASAQFIKDADAWARGLQGKLITAGFDAFKLLDVGAYASISSGAAKSKDLTLLKQLDETNTSMLRRIMDPSSVKNPVEIDKLDIPQDQKDRLRNLKEVYQGIFREIAEEGTNLKVLRTLEDGSTIISRPTKTGKIPRLATDELWRAVSDGAGPLYASVVSEVLELNPELTEFQAKKGLELWLGAKTIRKNGSLEEVRKIKIMPDHVLVNGKLTPILHTDPFYILTRGVELQTKRLAMIKYFGQGDALKNINTKRMRMLSSKIGVNLKFSKDEVRSRIVKRLESIGGSAELYDKMSLDDLKMLARGEGLLIEAGREDILDRLMSTDPENLTGEQKKSLISFAKEIGGIETSLEPVEGSKKRKPRPIQDVFNDVLIRTGYNIPDNFRSLQRRFAEEGGNTDDFDNVFRVWQGLPLNGRWLPRNPATRTLKVTSRVAGTLQTSLSVAVNVTQTLALVPTYGGFAKFASTVHDVLVSPETTRSQVTALGAFRETINHWQIERGFFPEGLARNLQQAVATGTGMRFVADMNSTIAGRMGLKLVDSIRNHKADGADIRQLKRLGLDDKELALARKGKVAELTKTKIVSNLVAKTQFTTEAAPFRGKIENMPIAKILFAYSNYTFGATRALVDTMNDIKALPKAVKDGNFAEIYGTIRSTMTMLVGSMGAGMAGSILRQALKGRPPEEPIPGEEEWQSRVRFALTGMAEVQLLGATQRVLDPFKYGDGVMEKVILGTMPQVSFITKLVGSVLGMGKFGRFGVTDRATRAFLSSTPIANATATYVEQIAHPDLVGFKQTQQISGKFAKNVLGRKNFIHGDVQINPVFFDVFESLKRSDIQGAIGDAKLYYRKRLQDTEFLTKVVEQGKNPLQEAVKTLRQSLLSRQPGNFNDVDTIKFFRALNTEDQKRAARVMLRYRRMVDIVAPK